ncbi:hypothetical protein M413DRAFT_27110 [Hebeloma cylindrosporum]|uniref:DUF6533 domain-containing protein n=1 Tax=Hebeloma cylindrosporum TaxID=76867 RepID=A0A0C3CFC4_HEBCY|nr:hypothetical protein M413DRAFT_27110 [Hebeloma cylindrosporum h7]
MFEPPLLLPYDSPPSASFTREVYHESSNAPFVGDSVILGALVLIASPISIYDYLCTFDQEVEYVWLRPRSFGRYLFILNRYLPIANLVLSYHDSVSKVHMSPTVCHRLFTVDIWLTLSGVFVAQVILYLRTIALWARNPWILWILGILAMCALTPCIVLAKIYTDSLEFAAAHPNSRIGCVLLRSNPIIFFVYILLFISETTVVVLTLIRAYKHLRHSNSWWVHQLYERGFLFYFYLLGFTILNLILTFIAPLSLKTSFMCIQQALHSLFCSRVIFIILSQQSRGDDVDFNTRVQPTDSMVLSSVLDTYVTRDELFLPHRAGNQLRYSRYPP